MAAFKIRQTVDLNSSGPQEIKQAHGHVGDKKAHEWEVSVVRGGAPVDLTGYAAMALVNNGVGTVQITGAITGNVASAVFPAACYTEGPHECFMRISNAGDSSEAITATMHLNVTTGETDTVIDPGADITTTLSGLLASEAARVGAEEDRVAAEETRAAFYDGFSSQLAEKANQTDVDDVQAQVNALVLGSGTDPAMVVQALVGHDGTTFETLKARLDDSDKNRLSCVSVKAFGANGDGLTDDTLAIQAAFNSGYNVYIPKGTYLVSSSIVWPTRYGWKLFGDRGLSILKCTTDIKILTPPAGDLGQYGTIDGIMFRSAVTGQGTGIGGPSDSYIAHLYIHQCDFQNTLRYGIDGNIINCDIDLNRFGNVGISMPGHTFKAIRSVGVLSGRESNMNRIRNNEIILCNDDFVVEFVNGAHVVFEGNTFENNAPGFGVIKTSQVAQAYALRNWFEANGNGAYSCHKIVGSGAFRTLNVFEGNHVNCAGAPTSCVIDHVNCVTPGLSILDNTIIGTTIITKDGSGDNPTSGVVRYGGNNIMGGTTPFNANGINSFGGMYLEALKSVVSPVVKSFSSVTSVPKNVATTILTLPTLGSETSVYLITVAQFGNSAGSLSASAIVIVNGATLSKLTLLSSSTFITTITISGLAISITQTSSLDPVNITATATRIA